MKNWKVKFSSQTVSFFLEGKFAAIDKMMDKANAFYITDENVYALHQKKFKGKKNCMEFKTRAMYWTTYPIIFKGKVSRVGRKGTIIP